MAEKDVPLKKFEDMTIEEKKVFLDAEKAKLDAQIPTPRISFWQQEGNIKFESNINQYASVGMVVVGLVGLIRVVGGWDKQQKDDLKKKK